MNYTDTIKTMTEAIVNSFQTALKKAKFDRTFDAVVKEVTSSDRCVIEYQKRSYSCSHYVTVNVGDRVKVCAPCNDWNSLYVTVNKTGK